MSPARESSPATAPLRSMRTRSGMRNLARCHRGVRQMTISSLAGKPAPKEMLVDLSRLKREYFDRRPDPDDPAQRVAFGTSRHRGSPLHGSFNEAHILAITQAICDYRCAHATDGPLYM